MNAPLKLLLVGDMMLGRGVNERLRDEPPEYPWGDTLPLLRDADWRACNLECVITDHGSPWGRTPKTFHFQTDAKNLAVSLANNHTLDLNHRGLVEMLRLLDGSHIAHCGAGLNEEEAARLVVSEVRGVRIGMLSFTDNEPPWEAGPDHPGVLYVPVEKPDERTARLRSLVSLASAEVDVLIVAAHWGGNWGYRVPAAHTQLAHDLIRAGADVIFGQSAHVCRGVEVFEGGLILYSTGDFVDDYAVDPLERNDRSWIFEIQVHNGQVSHLHLHPTVIYDCHACLAKQAVAEQMMEWMRELSAKFGTSSAKSPDSRSLVIDVQRQTGTRQDLQKPTKRPLASAIIA